MRPDISVTNLDCTDSILVCAIQKKPNQFRQRWGRLHFRALESSVVFTPLRRHCYLTSISSLGKTTDLTGYDDFALEVHRLCHHVHYVLDRDFVLLVYWKGWNTRPTIRRVLFSANLTVSDLDWCRTTILNLPDRMRGSISSYSLRTQMIRRPRS